MRGRPRSEQADQAILSATVRQLREEGYARLSIEAVAAEAAVGRPTIYRRYRNKAELAIAALASIKPPVPAAVSGDLRADLVAYLHRVERTIDDIGVDLVASLHRDPELLELHRERIIRPRVEFMRGLLAAAQASGGLRPDADTALVLEMLVGSIFARYMNGRRAGEDWPERAVAMLWEGICSRPADG